LEWPVHLLVIHYSDDIIMKNDIANTQGQLKMEWHKRFKYDPIKPLLESNNEPVQYFTRHDLLRENVGPTAGIIWNLKTPQSILKKQQPGGFWIYPGKKEEYYLLATFKNLQTLIYQYGFDRSHPAIKNACESLFFYQTGEGDIRGFIGNQYAPYYTGIVMAQLINAGYENDPRIEKGFRWLLSMRQNDGGWVIGSPGFLGIHNLRWKDIIEITGDRNAETLKAFDKVQPFSHSGTGMVIRAFAAHPLYRKSPEALQAANLLKSHFFKEDNYNSYKSADHWVRFGFPFWWNNLLAVMDSLSLFGIPETDKDIKRALDWFIANQQEDGLWESSYSNIHKASENSKTHEQRLWITLAICRIFQRYYS
jgi:hypothetical protein